MAMYYIIYNGQQVGPMDKQQLVNYGLNPNSQVWCEGMPQWAPAYTVPELMELINQYPGRQAPPQPMAQPMYGGQRTAQQGYNQPAYYPQSDKNKVTAGVLALLLGSLGIQYFYLGKAGAGVLTIVLTLVSCGIWGIIPFIQGIVMLCMSDQEFERKYVNTKSWFPLF